MELSSYLYDRARLDEPAYGYPRPVFVFMESLLWFAQANRSGVSTYYEATPKTRQNAMLQALESEAPREFAAQYLLGMQNWQDESMIETVDAWMQNNDEDNNRWLWRLANEHRAAFERFCGEPISGTTPKE